MLLRSIACVVVGVLFLGPAAADIVYLYDELGRLTRVIDERGQAATYRYDAVGNLLQISRESSVPQTTTVSRVSPSTLQVGLASTVTITGSNLLGAVITGGPGLIITPIEVGLDVLIVRILVVVGLPPGPASLTIRTDLATISVPVTIAPSPLIITTVAGSGIDARLVGPNGVATDSQGQVFIADGNQIKRVNADRTITRVAGVETGEFGFNGDGGPATGAWLFSPQGVTVDTQGNLFIADTDNDRIRKVSVDGSISTVAGNGVTGFSGDGAPATSARLNHPFGVAVDGQGTFFIADTYNHRIRRVGPDGTITTVVGTGVAGFGGDGGPALDAWLFSPQGVAMDLQGNLFIADTENHRIRRVSVDGIISTVAGDGVAAWSGDGGPAAGARLNHPAGVTVDSGGVLFISDGDNQRVRRVSTDGTISTLAGTGVQGLSGDGGPAAAAQLAFPQGITADDQGNVFVADSANGRIRQVNGDGIMSTLAGPLDRGFGGDGGPATQALLDSPLAVTVDGQGALFIADTDNQRVRKVSAAGTVTTVAGNGVQGTNGDGGPAITAQLRFPESVAVDSGGNLFITDPLGHRIRRVGPDGTITTVAGTGAPGFGGDGGPATAAQLNGPIGAAVDGQGNLFVADTDNNRIRRVSAGGVITTVAGTGVPGFGGDGGPATGARLFLPRSVAVDGQGALFIADTSNRRVRRVGADGAITTVAGTGGRALNGDGGPATGASFVFPVGVAVDGGGNFYVADSGDNRIRRVSADGTITTAAGTGEFGFAGDGGPAVSATLSSPSGVAVDRQGHLFIADTLNNRVRKVPMP